MVQVSYMIVLGNHLGNHYQPIGTCHILEQEFIITGAYEPLKAAKEHETYAACWVPSQSKLFVN